MSDIRWGRRDFIRLSALAGGALGSSRALDFTTGPQDKGETTQPCDALSEAPHSFNGTYEGARLSQIAFPMGGMGAGMICLEGTGALSKLSLRYLPDLNNQPKMFAAIYTKQPHGSARILEGPVPLWKLRPWFPGGNLSDPRPPCWGLPRFSEARFQFQFPFATVHLEDDAVPFEVEMTGWSPFSPGDADNSSLPVAALEYKFVNRSGLSVESVFSFNTENFMVSSLDPSDPKYFVRKPPLDRIRPTKGGFILYGPEDPSRPSDGGSWAFWSDDPKTKINHVWFRSSGFNSESFGQTDAIRMAWNDVASGACYSRDPLPNNFSPGASLFVPFTLAPGETRTLSLKMAWYIPRSTLVMPKVENPKETYKPWYAGRFSGIDDIITYWQEHYTPLREASAKFARALYDSTLPPVVTEAVAANLTILKSPTFQRQTDGRLSAFEGCNETAIGGGWGMDGIYIYAQAIAHLFPSLERRMRDTEFGPSESESGFQADAQPLPYRPLTVAEVKKGMPGGPGTPLGRIIMVHRDWRISGDTDWLRRLWPNIRASLDYCTRTWDPKQRGWIEEAHFTTYDSQFWGADSLHTSLYVCALKAAVLMGTALGESVGSYRILLSRGVSLMEAELFNGEYFFQKIEWKNLQTPYPNKYDEFGQASPEELARAKREGPSHQYGLGCLSDGLMGEWLGSVCGVGPVLDAKKVESHLVAVHRYNLKTNFTEHVCIYRPIFASALEAGLLVCTWPRAGKPSLPFVYSDEVWTGIEYEVASHLIALGKIDEGLQIVRSCRDRYDGRVRNPFDELEAGHWYGRAMSSYALFQAFSGARFDAVDKILYLRPTIKGDFRCFFSTAFGYGTVGVRKGQPFVEVVSGHIPYSKIEYAAAT